jgi:hypothetical protein
MKKLLGILVLGLGLVFSANANSKTIGEGNFKMDDWLIDYFHQYIQGKGRKTPGTFVVAVDGSYATYWYCPAGQCRFSDEANYIIRCEMEVTVECKVFARKRYIKWKNGINPGKGKVSKISPKLNLNELKSKLNELGFYGNTTTTEKVEKKKEKKKKVVKTYSLEGKRSIALSWDGYSDLIAGTVEFDEADYKGTLNLPLPNNDGTCEGSYSLQTDNKGTWQISCTNNMGAAGTLIWTKDGGVTGTGRDHNDKKVKFTVSKKS